MLDEMGYQIEGGLMKCPPPLSFDCLVGVVDVRLDPGTIFLGGSFLC